jgi:site-specific recombinase XerC
LGTKLAAAVEKAETLNAAFDSWKNGETTESAAGTVQWLFAWYRRQDRYKTKSAKTRKDYHRIMDRICAEPMKVGTFGQRRAGAIDAAAADNLYKRFKAYGKRMGSYAMQVCRLVWTWAVRHHKTTGVTENPFLKMGIETGAEAGNRDTSRAEYNLYRETARNLGYQSMATAAALAFEFCQRVWDVFGFVDPDGKKKRGFVWPDYRPGESFAFKQSKTGKPMRLPLHEVVGRQKVPLYPELEEELGRTPRTGLLIVVQERTGLPYTERRMSKVHREICDAAGLPKKMTFTGFRHGGATELGDAGVDDLRSITGHDQTSTTRIYNKVNERKAGAIALKRREHLALLADLEAGEDGEPAADLSERPNENVGMKGGKGS